MRSDKNNIKVLSLQLLQLFIIILTGSFLIYRIKSPLSNFIFYSLLFCCFLFSRKIVFWTFVLFIIICYPWGLFNFPPYEWYFKLTPTVGVVFTSIYGIIFILKALFDGNTTLKMRDLLKRYYRPVAYSILFLLLWSILYGFNTVALFNILQFLPSFLLFLVIPGLFRKEGLLHFNKLVLIFSLIHFGGSLVEIVSPGSFLPLVYFGQPRDIVYEEGLIRITGGITVHLYSIVISLLYLTRREKIFKSWYLWLIIATSILFIINSATRGWMIASSFLIGGYLIYYFLRVKQSFKIFAGIVLILFILALIIPDSVRSNITAAFNRLETVEVLASGDISAGGTLARLTERGPRVLTMFNQSPVVGFGYSKVSSDYYDGHVGNHCLLLMGGVIGLAVVWITVFSLIWFFFRLDRHYPGDGYFVFALFLMTVMIIHSSSRVMISFYMPADSAFLIALVFNHFNAMSQALTNPGNREDGNSAYDKPEIRNNEIP